MCPERSPESGVLQKTRRHQRGFSVIMGIFLLLLLAALGAFMVTLSTTQNVTSAQDLQGARAYQAANAGIEWGVYRAAITSSCTSTTITTLSDDLAPFTVTVTGTLTTVTEGGANVNICSIRSTAVTGTVGSVNFIERQLMASVAF